MNTFLLYFQGLSQVQSYQENPVHEVSVVTEVETQIAAEQRIVAMLR